MMCQHSIALNEKVYCNQRGYRVRMSTQGRTFNCMLSGIVRVYRCTSTDDELVRLCSFGSLVMPRWAEPRRHTVVVVCVCVCLWDVPVSSTPVSSTLVWSTN